MRPVYALPLCALGFAMGFNTFGAFLMVKSRVKEAMAVSTTTLTSASVETSASPANGAPIDALAAVRAKAPKDAETKLGFELARTPLVHDGLVSTVVRPAGWKSSNEMFPEKVAPPGRKMGETGWLTHLDVGTDCDGSCSPKDWAAIIDKKSKLAVGDGATTHEERSADGRLVRWSTKADSAHVYAAWFVAGESRMYTCSAWLDEKALVPYVDAFVEICKTAKIEKR